MKEIKAEPVGVGGIELQLGPPVEGEQEWIGQVEPLRELLACWLVVDEKGPAALSPSDRAARDRQDHPGHGRGAPPPAVPLHLPVHQRHPSEDLLITPVLAGSGKIAYHASPLVAALLKGGSASWTRGTG